MLSFISKIRRSVFNSGNSRKYLLYALGEVVLVVFGILIALQANNWNENRKERELELQMLYEMKKGLEGDVADIIYNISAHERILRSQHILIDWIDSNRSYHDSLSHHFSISNNSTVFVSNEGPYSTVKQMGIRMITNDSLRDKIQEVYDLDFEYYKDHILMYNDLVFNAWENVNSGQFEATRFKFSNPQNVMAPLNPDALKTHNFYTYTLKTAAEFNGFYIEKIMKRARDRGQELIAMIDRELMGRGYQVH